MKAAHWADSFRRSEPSAEMIAIERAKAFLTDVSETSEMRNRNAHGALTAIASEVPEPIADVAQVLAWIDRTLALPIYQGGELTDYADATVTALRSVRKMLDGTSRPDASWRNAEPQGEPSDDEIRVATLAALKKGAKSDAENVRNYREAERVIRAALPYLRCPQPQGEPSDAQALADEIEGCMRRQEWLPADLAIRAVAALRVVGGAR